MRVDEIMDGDRIHISNKPLKLMNRIYEQRVGRKPNGLWWAFDKEWEKLVNKKTKLNKYKKGMYTYEVIPNISTMLRLISWDDILNFSIKFGKTYAPGGVFFWQTGNGKFYDINQDEQYKKLNHCKVPAIDWISVARLYSGIEIPRLSYERPKIDWLDIDWEIASGCSWNINNIKITPLT